MKVCEFGRLGRKEIFYEKITTPKAVWCGRQVAVTESLMSPLKKKKTKDKSLAAMPKSSNEQWTCTKKINETIQNFSKPAAARRLLKTTCKRGNSSSPIIVFHRVTWTRTRLPATEQDGSEDRESRHVFGRYHQTEQEKYQRWKRRT